MMELSWHRSVIRVLNCLYSAAHQISTQSRQIWFAMLVSTVVVDICDIVILILQGYYSRQWENRMPQCHWNNPDKIDLWLTATKRNIAKPCALFSVCGHNFCGVLYGRVCYLDNVLNAKSVIKYWISGVKKPRYCQTNHLLPLHSETETIYNCTFLFEPWSIEPFTTISSF